MKSEVTIRSLPYTVRDFTCTAAPTLADQSPRDRPARQASSRRSRRTRGPRTQASAGAPGGRAALPAQGTAHGGRPEVRRRGPAPAGPRPVTEARTEAAGTRWCQRGRPQTGPCPRTFFISFSRLSSSWPSDSRRLRSAISLSADSRYCAHWPRSCSSRRWNWCS